MHITIRDEVASDIAAISEITRAAFANHPYSNQTEEFIVHAPRKANALMQEGLSRLKALGARGCMLVGAPGYFERFGFRSRFRLVHEGVPRANSLVLPFGEGEAAGTVVFHEGFGAIC